MTSLPPKKPMGPRPSRNLKSMAKEKAMVKSKDAKAGNKLGMGPASPKPAMRKSAAVNKPSVGPSGSFAAKQPPKRKMMTGPKGEIGGIKPGMKSEMADGVKARVDAARKAGTFPKTTIMKKGGCVKKYAKGGGVKKYAEGGETSTAKKVSSKAMKLLNKYIGEPVAGANAYLDEKATGRIPQKLREALFGENPEKFSDDIKEITKRLEKEGYKKGGCVKKYARGGGIEVRGKTKGRII